MRIQTASISLRAGWMPVCFCLFSCTLWAAPSAEQQAKLKQQFEAARQLVTAGKFEQALGRFDAILQVDPAARGSLLMSGLVHNRLYQFNRAAGFFDRFLALEPDHVSGALGALKAYQSSGQNEKAEAVRRRILSFHRDGSDPRLARMLNYEREARRLDDGRAISILEMFPGDDGVVWKLLLIGPDLEQIQRRLQWKLADADERALMGFGQDDPPLWILGEPIYGPDGLSDFKIRKLHEGSLTYPEAVAIGTDQLIEPAPAVD